ncbi:bile acid:sodium symporter family protein, partial [Brevibacillus agri]
MPVLTPSSVAIGVLAGTHLQPYAFLSPWVFAFMTFAGSLGAGFKEFAKVLTRPLPLVVNLLILHALMPFI